MTDTETISNLQAENASQSQKIKSLEEKVELLLELLQKKVIKKDSHNSSLPPSSPWSQGSGASVSLCGGLQNKVSRFRADLCSFR